MINTSNHHGKTNEIIFKMLKKTKVCIKENSTLKAGFSVNQRDNIGKKEEKKDRSAKVSKPKIKLIKENKRKDKEDK